MNTQSFQTADAAIEALITQGFDKVDYDPSYPYMLVWNDRDGVKARVIWSDSFKAYVIDSVRL
jgi:hypothetical protein